MGLPSVVQLAHAAGAQGQVRLGVHHGLVRDEVELARLGGQVDLHGPLDEPLAAQAVADDVGHGAHLQFVARAELLQVARGGPWSRPRS